MQAPSVQQEVRAGEKIYEDLVLNMEVGYFVDCKENDTSQIVILVGLREDTSLLSGILSLGCDLWHLCAGAL